MSISDAQRRAVAKYNAENYDRIELRVNKGKKQAIKELAASQNMSLNEYVNAAIDEKTERDNFRGATE